MGSFWGNFAIEIGILSFLGVLYYFYQKRKIIHYEENKDHLVMSFILQSCLAEKGETPEPQLDSVIEALDDYLQSKASQPPVALLKIYAQHENCSHELKDVILHGLEELNEK